MNISFEKIVRTVERDIRNQVVIDQLKRLNRRDRMLVAWNRYAWNIIVVFCALFWVLFCLAVRAHATECPTPGEKCKVIFLTEQEEKMLMGQNGILDTAAQARALDLGQFAVYLKTRINGAAQGEVQPLPSGSGSASKSGPASP
jgi:hypothetical protein